MTTEYEVRKFVAPEFIFGVGALELTAQYVHNLGGHKVLLVTDPGLIEAGWAGKVEQNLAAGNIAYTVFGDVTPNPKDHEVAAGVEVYRSEGCDLIVAVGGGSVMDCAKGIGIVHANEESIHTYEGVDEVPLPGPAMICIPTTAGTAADISQFAIINHTAKQYKMAIVSKLVVPDAALIDPRTTLTMSAQLTAETGMDALVHAFESYVSNASSPITDLNAVEAVRIIARTLPVAVHRLDDLRYRTDMMLASTLAGLAFSNASLGLVHAMAHSLGGLKDLPHGECNAILLRRVVDFNFDSAIEKYTHLAQLMGVDTEGRSPKQVKEALLNQIEVFTQTVGIAETLGTLGIRRQIIPALADYAIKDACVVTNPKPVEYEDVITVYEQAI